MQSTDFITVPGWAITELKLSGNELLLYSLIHGYTKTSDTLDEEGNQIQVTFWFARSLDYVSEILNISKNTACSIMNTLHEKGLIEKDTIKKGVITLCRYRTKPLSLTVSNPAHHTKNLDGTIQETCTARHTKNLYHISNNTISNTTNSVISNVTKSNITTTAATPRSSLLKSTPVLEKKKNNKVKFWTNSKIKLLQRYNFSPKVYSELLKFLQMLVELGTLVPDISIQTQLDELIKLSEEQQYEVIHSTIGRGWKSLIYVIKDLTTIKRPAFDTATKSVPELKDPNNDRRHELYEGQEIF